MKTHAPLVAILALIAVGGSVRGDPVKGEACPRVCTFELNPVCGVYWGHRFETFPTDCARRSHNCQTRETFEFVCNGTCKYASQEASQPRAGLLPASSLCVPWGK